MTEEVLDIKGQQLVNFMLVGRQLNHTFFICPLSTEAVGLLGTDFLERKSDEISFERGRLALSAIDETPQAYGVARAKHVALTVISEKKGGLSPQPKRREESKFNEQHLDDIRSAMLTQGKGV